MSRPLQVTLSVLALLAILAGRVLYESGREFRRAEGELAAGRTEEAIHHLGRSVRWYLPGNPYTLRALGTLWRLGQEAEKGDPRRALLAYDSIRGSLHAVRSFYWPHKAWILRVNDRIARLRAREQVGNEPGLSFEKALEFHTRVLVPDERPYIGWVFWAGVGFFGWILSVLAWIWKGFDADGRMQARRSLPWMAAIVVFFAIWVIGLARA